MSIRDYNMNYVVINGVTNEQIKVPKTNKNMNVLSDIKIDDLLLLDVIREELRDCDSVSIFKSYMKD